MPVGDVYEGDFKMNQMYGKGTYRHADGEEYSGEWQKDMKHGVGRYKYASKYMSFILSV